jgi:peptidyl-prolyl cis-trans isomerase SurA
MKKRWLTGSALVAVSLTACGCAAQPHWGTPDGASPLQLPAPRAQAGPNDPLPGVARSQKPEGDALKEAPDGLPPVARPADLITGQPAARIGATVNNQAILNEEVLAAAYQGLMTARDLPEPERSQRRAEIWNQALTQLVEREVVLQDAFKKLESAGGKKNLDKLKEEASEQFEKSVLRNWMKAGQFKTQDDFRDYLKAQGVSLEMLRRQWERNFMAMEYLRSRVHPFTEQVRPQQILEYYDKHPEEFHQPDSVKWQDLFVQIDKFPSPGEAHRFAEQLAERARAGEDFAKLAEQFDNGDSSFRKGVGIGSKRGEIRPPEAENTLFQLKDGETAVIELEKGFHVVRVVKRELDGSTPFDEKTQKQIKEKLTAETAQLEMKRIVNKLKHEAVIVYAKGEN